MRIVCDTYRNFLTPEQSLVLKGWRVYDGACKDFASHDNFYSGKLIPVSQAVEAQRLTETAMSPRRG